MIAGYEQWFLYSPRCNRQDNFVWLENEPDTRSNNAIEKRLKSLLAAKSSKYAAGRAQITVVGHFIGPGGKRFGHLDQFRMKFVAIRVEQARSVFPHTRWPVTNGATGSADEAEQTIGSINKEFVFHLAGSPTYSAIPSDFFADDFRFTDPNGNQTKAEFLATSVPIFPGKIYNTEIEVQVRGDVAVATGIMTKSVNDSPREQYRYTNNYIKRNGAWQIVSSSLKRP